MKQLTRVISLILCVAALLFTIFLGTQALKNADSDRYADDPLPPLTVQVLNVGKGDAILVTYEDHCMVIDTGYDDTAPILLDALEAAGVEKIDALIITHYHKDHVGGADKLIEAYPVETALVAPYESDSKQYRQFIEAADKAGLELQPVTETLRFSLGDVGCMLYPPLLDEYDEENNYSLVLSLTHGADRFLFAADAENRRLEELMSQMPLEHSFLKVPHHGRVEDSSGAFFHAVHPAYAAITCSEDKPADPEVLELLEHLGTEIYQSTYGDITVVSRGTGSLEITQG